MKFDNRKSAIFWNIKEEHDRLDQSMTEFLNRNNKYLNGEGFHRFMEQYLNSIKRIINETKI